MTKLQVKWAFLLGLVALSFFFLYPSIDWYSKPADERTKLESLKARPKWLLNLGLDLKGGTHLLMEVEVDKLPAGETIADAVARAIEVMRNRIDQFGVAEPLIAKQGDRWIVIQLPGITDSQAAKDLVGKTALLEFRMVDSSEAANVARQKLAELGESPFEEQKPGELPKLKAAALKLLPPNTTLMPDRESGSQIVSAVVPLTGAALETARVNTGGDYGMPVVDFKMHAADAKKFADLTRTNVGKNMAIVLDGVIYSAPVIKSPITGGSGYIEGNFKIEDARNLAIVLRAGALPAPVRIIEERTVGPTLGEDSIRSGLRACAIGLAFIFLFFVFLYRLSGMFTVGVLLLNLLFLLAMMSYFGSTLTLPGIAGLALNIAMAVDANVLILERIREELKKGKPIRLAVEAGFDMSASAIFDSNLTVLAAGALLFQFGTGPIKGFAVTLTLGTVISMFTATVPMRMLYEAWLSDRDIQTLSI